MGEAAPEGLEVERVDWLDSGGHSGLLRIRGRRASGGPLPELVIPTPAGEQRHASLPDPRGTGDPGTWRGAYVVPAELVLAAGERMTLELPSGGRVPVPAPVIDRGAAPAARAPEDEPPAGEVVDRAVLAERRARRAEAAEQAQARIAREALRAVEILERRAAELEDQLERAGAEPARQAGDEGAQALRSRLRELEAELAEARAVAAVPATAPVSEPAAGDADRRVERLRAALSSAIVTIGDLRVQLHEARVQRRTSDVEHGADGVRLAVLASERAAVQQELAGLRARLEDMGSREAQLRAEVEQALARATAAERSHEETRRHLAERTAELREAREQVVGLESRLEVARAEAERALSEELPRAVRKAVDETREALEARHVGATAALEEQLAAARSDLERLERELGAAETARELAEAQTATAIADRQATEVAWATLADELAALRGEDPAPRPELLAELERERAERRRLQAALAEAERRAAAAGPVEPAALAELARTLRAQPADPTTAGRLVADLEAAAAALREGAAAPPVRAQPPEPPAAPERPAPIDGEDGPPASSTFLPPAPPVIDRPAAFEETEEPRRVVVSPAAELPPGVHAARGTRSYPGLRGALVDLARDDPDTAAAVLAGLLPAQWRAIQAPVEYDLTIEELGTYAVSVTPNAAAVTAVERPRPYAEFHLRADALSLAEMLAGFGPRPRRFGRVRVTGRRRRLKVLEPLRRTPMTLEQTMRAGAWLEPRLALRCLSYAVHPSWTRGHDFTVAHTLTDPDETVFLIVRDGRGLTVSEMPPPGVPDATVTVSRAAFMALLAGEVPAERPNVRGDHRVVDVLRSWTDRVRVGDLGERP